MEKPTLHERTTLLVTSYCLGVLLKRVLEKFTANNPDSAQGSVAQLYGFGNFDPEQPTLKNTLEQLAGGFINGKYLYDKSRELQAGKPVLKLSGFYRSVLFQYLGYDGIRAFVHHNIDDDGEQARQLELISSSDVTPTNYYVSYHFGEYKEIVKAQVRVLNDWKTVEYNYLYPQDDGNAKEFFYYGTVKKRADALHIRTRTLIEGKMVEGGESILHIGYGDPGRCAFILGTYTAFDINNRLIAGKVIHEKCDSKEQMIAKSRARKVPAFIVQEIRNERIENDAVIPYDKLDISPKSPYSITYAKIPGNYQMSFVSGETTLGDFAFSIDKETYKVTPATSGVLVNKDRFQLIQNGSVIHFSFQLTGIALFTRLEIFVKTYYLSRGEREVEGVFSGLDIENRLVNGGVTIRHTEG